MIDTRGLNAKIAAGYDLVPYDPQAGGYPGLDLAPVFGLAALHGGAPEPEVDVLDLGCGAGSQLERIAAQTSGRIVGVDLSPTACATARARCARFGARCEVRCADLADVSDLGRFDLIYLIGVLYVTPPDTQTRLLDLIAAGLKPGGAAVISYYASGLATVFHRLRPVLRTGDDSTLPPAARIQTARTRLADYARRHPPRDNNERAIFDHLQQCDEAGFFHEVLNETFEMISTSALTAALRARGIHFLNWMPPAPLGDMTQFTHWEPMADRFDVTAAGYRYAVFQKDGAVMPPGPRALQWDGRLKRLSAESMTFRDPALNVSIEIRNATTAGALDKLSAGIRDEDALFASAEHSRAVRQDFFSLWQNGLLTALWTGGARTPPYP